MILQMKNFWYGSLIVILKVWGTHAKFIANPSINFGIK